MNVARASYGAELALRFYDREYDRLVTGHGMLPNTYRNAADTVNRRHFVSGIVKILTSRRGFWQYGRRREKFGQNVVAFNLDENSGFLEESVTVDFIFHQPAYA